MYYLSEYLNLGLQTIHGINSPISYSTPKYNGFNEDIKPHTGAATNLSPKGEDPPVTRSACPECPSGPNQLIR